MVSDWKQNTSLHCPELPRLDLANLGSCSFPLFLYPPFDVGIPGPKPEVTLFCTRTSRLPHPSPLYGSSVTVSHTVTGSTTIFAVNWLYHLLQQDPSNGGLVKQKSQFLHLWHLPTTDPAHPKPKPTCRNSLGHAQLMYQMNVAQRSMPGIYLRLVKWLFMGTLAGF